MPFYGEPILKRKQVRTREYYRGGVRFTRQQTTLVYVQSSDDPTLTPAPDVPTGYAIDARRAYKHKQ